MSPYGSLDVYAVKGFETRVWRGEGAIGEGVAEDDEQSCTVAPSVSGGLRLSLNVAMGIEAGGSVARGWTGRGRSALTLTGLYVQGIWKVLSAKAEGLIIERQRSSHG